MFYFSVSIKTFEYNKIALPNGKLYIYNYEF